MKCQVYVETRESREEVRIKNSALVRAVLDGMPNSGSGPTGSQGSDLSRRCFPRQSSSSTYTSFVRLRDLNCKWRSRETRDFLPPLVDGVSVGWMLCMDSGVILFVFVLINSSLHFLSTLMSYRLLSAELCNFFIEFLLNPLNARLYGFNIDEFVFKSSRICRRDFYFP